MSCRRGIPLGALLLLAIAAAGARAHDTGARHLLLISLDGLRPEFYLDEAYAAPELRALLRAGSHARAAESVYPSLTYPGHASIVTGVRPARHGVFFNVLFDPAGERGRWYEEAADLRSTPLWEWARAAGRRTAGVSWPSTVGAPIDALLPERDYYVRHDALDRLRAAVTPGLFERLGVSPREDMFRNVLEWDAFLTATAAALIREDRPHLLLLHLVQLDYFQHRGGREGAEVKPALLRVDAHLGALRRALVQAGLAERAAIIVTGDHGFRDVRRVLFPNQLLADAGLRACPRPGPDWRATAHIAGGAAAVFVSSAGDGPAALLAETALRGAGADRLTIVSRAELDALGAMPGAAFAIEPSPGFELSGSCSAPSGRPEGPTLPDRMGMHGYLPTHPDMATGFVAAGAGVRPGVALERVRLIDIAPTAARLLGVAAPAVEGRVLAEILRVSPPELFDTHTHLHFPEYAGDRAAVLARARAAGVTGMVTIGTDLAASQAAVALAAEEPDVWASVGVHPHDAAAGEAALPEIERLARAPRVVAIGEIGLDFFRNHSPRDVQIDVFRRQLDLARRAGLPVVIHCRDAHAEALAILAEARVGEIGGVMHCFSGDVAVARACLDLGLLISLAGPVTYKSARALPEVARFVPADRLVLETDCPFLPPEGHRGQRNEPAYVSLTAARVAALRAEPLDRLAGATSDNARALFRLG